jgi:hypothetical protein
MEMMDSELIRLVQAVKDGKVSDPRRVRPILDDARKRIADVATRVRDLETLLFEAEQAFIRGWPNPQRRNV